MAYKFNPTTGKLDTVADPGGSDTQIQFNDSGSFGGDADLTYNKTTNALTIGGDVTLNDGGSFTTTLQTITPTANRTVSLPDATGTVALVAGSSGQFIYNNAGALGGTAALSIDGSGNITQSTGVYYSPLGTAAAPPVSFSGDPNTGIYSPGADQVAISTNGTGRLSIDANGNVNIDSDTLYVDAVNNRVGVGNSSPQVAFHVGPGTSSMTVPNGAGVNFSPQIFNNQTSGVAGLGVGVLDGTNNRRAALFVDQTNGIWGLASTYSSGEPSFVIRAASNERLRIDSSGRLLVGTSSGNSLFNGGTQNPQFQLEGTTGNTSLASITANRNDAAGPTLYMAHSRGTASGGTTILQSGDQCGVLAFAGTDGTDYATAATITVSVDGTPGANDMPGRLVFSTTADGAASPTERMRITSTGQVRLAGAGITFNGDTATANELDDYEEGTFTPTIVGTTDAGTGTYTIQTGVYTKVGNVIHYAITILWTAHTGTGNMRIDGLPFTARNLANYNPSVTLDVNNLTSPANTIVTGTVLSNTTLVGLNSVPVAGGARASLALDTAGTVWASGSYTV